MRRSTRFFAASLLATSSLAARADLTTVYTLDNLVLTGGNNSRAGIVTLDETTGVWTAADFSLLVNGVAIDSFSTAPSESVQDGLVYAVFLADQTPPFEFALTIADPTFIGFSGADVCSFDTFCDGLVSGFLPVGGGPGAEDVFSGSLAVYTSGSTDPTATP
jgi:hypothetical protein